MSVVTQLYFQIAGENNYMFRPFSGWDIIRLRLEYWRKLIYYNVDIKHLFISLEINTYPQRIRCSLNVGHIFQEKKCVLLAGKYGTYIACFVEFVLFHHHRNPKTDYYQLLILKILEIKHLEIRVCNYHAFIICK
jgi:hypothetical protein